MFRCFYVGSYLRFLRWPAAPALLIAVLLAFGCEGGLLVESPANRQVGTSSAFEPFDGPQAKLGDHDPEAKVYESLRPKAEVLAELKSGECLAHFARAGSDKFTPLPFALDWPQGEPAVEDGKTPAVASVGRLRGEQAVLRVLCLFPNTDWHRGALAKLFEEQLAKPPFKQDADGWLKVRDKWKDSGPPPRPWRGPGEEAIAESFRFRSGPAWALRGPVLLDDRLGSGQQRVGGHAPVSGDRGVRGRSGLGRSVRTCMPTGGGSGPTVPPPPPPPPRRLPAARPPGAIRQCRWYRSG